MNKVSKIIILGLLLLAAGILVYKKFHASTPSVYNQEVMKQNILTDPKINAPNLTDEQKAKFLAQFKTVRENVVKSNFDTLQGLNQLALLKQLLGDWEGARIAWEYANIVRPKNSLSFSNLAALYHYNLKQFDKAEQNYLISIANDPADIPTIRNLYDLYHRDLKDEQKAESLLLQAIQDNPQTSDLYALAGKFYSDLGQLEHAIEYYQKHLVLNPKNEIIKKEIDKLKTEIK